jgi:hypothetical protein
LIFHAAEISSDARETLIEPEPIDFKYVTVHYNDLASRLLLVPGRDVVRRLAADPNRRTGQHKASTGDQAMPSVHVDAVVRLKEDMHARRLHSGDQGVVLAVWLSHDGFLCEVVFPGSSGDLPVRALLRPTQLEVVNSQPHKEASE